MKIKIEYKGKLHSIGQEIHSIEEIVGGVQARYPEDFKNGINLKISNREIKTFEDIVDFWRINEFPASVKLTISEKEGYVTSGESLEEKPIKIESSGKVYKCWKCKNKMTSEGCVICEGAGELTPDHPFMEFCEQLIKDRVNAIIKQLRIGQYTSALKKQTQVELSVIDPTKLKAQFCQVPLNLVKSFPNLYYNWDVSLTNNGTIAWPQSTSVYRLSDKSPIKSVKGLSVAKSVSIPLYLKAQSEKGIVINEFRLGYLDGQSVVFFGPKFGFQLDTNVEEPKKLSPEEQYQYEMTKMVRESVKYISHQRHSVEYIVEKMREFGISTSSSKDIIVDVILQLQSYTA